MQNVFFNIKCSSTQYHTFIQDNDLELKIWYSRDFVSK